VLGKAVRIVFVDNLLFEDAEGIKRYVLQPHLGLISLISVIEAAGHEGLLFDPKVDVARGQLRLDADLYREIARAVLRLRPDAVGFTSLGCNFICTAKAAAYLKQWEPDLPILLGGPHATVLERTILAAFPQFDVIVRNEAEETILSVIEALPKRAFRDVAGISFLASGAVQANLGEPLIADLDKLPVPAYHRYPVRELGLTSLRIDAGRGCPFQCTFCSTASFFGRRYRLKSAMRLREELDFLNREYGIFDFALTHDLFTVNRRKVIEFCDVVEGRGYTWKCSARQDCVDEELLERMRAAGCRSIYYGIESGSARMQAISKKRLDLSLFDPIVDATQKLGMAATVSFITGYPEEEKADQAATLDLISHSFGKSAAPLNVQLHLLTPEPGTDLLKQYGPNIAYDGYISDFNFPTLEANDSQVLESNPGVFINHHYFPAVLPRDRLIFVTTCYQYLYGLGFPLLLYILRRFDCRLSKLIDSMDAWRLEGGFPAACTRDMIAAYFAKVFGATHHLTGLVRYMLTAAELRRRAINGEGAVATAGNTLGGYVLSGRAAVLLGVPDCQRILQALSENANSSINRAWLNRRYDFLLHLPPPGTDAIENLQLNRASAAFFEYVTKPRRRGLKCSFEYATGYPMPPTEFVQALARRGILEVRNSVAAKDYASA
jgi:radical SAM superfamily enzyme YgiQ (UPF0313 family)